MNSIQTKIPKIPYWLLKKMTHTSIREGYSGDIEEEFDDILNRKRKMEAVIWIWFHAIVADPSMFDVYSFPINSKCSET